MPKRCGRTWSSCAGITNNASANWSNACRIDFGGYFRAGYGRNDQGGPQVVFQAPRCGAKYRLGNVAENYGELILGNRWFVPGMFSLDAKERPDGTPARPVARAQFRVSFFNPYTDLGSGTDTEVALPASAKAVGSCASTT